MLYFCTDFKTAQLATVNCDDFMQGSFAMLSVNSQPIHAVDNRVSFVGKPIIDSSVSFTGIDRSVSFLGIDSSVSFLGG